MSQGIEKRYEGIAMANKPTRIAQETPSLQSAETALGHTARLMRPQRLSLTRMYRSRGIARAAGMALGFDVVEAGRE
jgi:hypothetical protein